MTFRGIEMTFLTRLGLFTQPEPREVPARGAERRRACAPWFRGALASLFRGGVREVAAGLGAPLDLPLMA